jgi:hypothetical protein
VGVRAGESAAEGDAMTVQTRGKRYEAYSEARANAVLFMRAHIESGGRVIFGTMEPLQIGASFGKAGDKLLVVTRRATRDEFIENAIAPFSEPPDSMPFYWEAGIAE